MLENPPAHISIKSSYFVLIAFTLSIKRLKTSALIWCQGLGPVLRHYRKKTESDQTLNIAAENSQPNPVGISSC